MFPPRGHRPPHPTAEALLPLATTQLARALRAASLVLVAAAAACSSSPRLSVQVCSDLAVPAELDAVRLVLFDGQREVERFARVFELVECPAGRVRTLPQVVEVPSPGGTAWLRVEGLRDGVLMLSAEVRLIAGDGEDAPVPVSLVAACLGQVCPKGQTCLIDGCAAAPYHSETPMRCAAAAGESDAG
ncbi:MAG: hypothetical protein H6744_03420, partial [Deltaproteobacteria bacterium]|nr:hypothetical protein [Deltaproteobacteria bacterium]